MLVDLHAHTKAISHCCRATAEEVYATAVEYGFDGLVITNHYASYYYTDESYGDWIESYIGEWEHCRKLGIETGIKTFCAVEVTMDYMQAVHLLVYGADEAFLRNNPHLGKLSQKELYEICKSNGCALIQAHPYRNGTKLQDALYLDGVEINCHPLYHTSCAAAVERDADENGFALTVGCDYHADSYRAKGGVFLPDTVTDERKLAEYLLTSPTFTLQIHEPEDNRIYKKVYQRKTGK